MPVNQMEKPSTTKLPIFFLIDVSDTMRGVKIDSVNNAMSVALETLEKRMKVTGVEAMVNVLKFGCNEPEVCQWMNPTMLPLGRFEWKDLVAENMTPLGEAFCELDSKLSSRAFLSFNGSFFAPVIILISDGNPNNSKKAREGLERLNTNNYFVNSERMALAIDFEEGDEAFFLQEFVKGSPNGKVFYEVEDAERLIQSIQKIVINTAMIGATRLTSGKQYEKALEEDASDADEDDEDKKPAVSDPPSSNSEEEPAEEELAKENQTPSSTNTKSTASEEESENEE